MLHHWVICFLLPVLSGYMLKYIPPSNENQPEQVRIAFGTNASSEVTVTWTTFQKTSNSLVEYGLSPRNLSFVEQGKFSLFVDGGFEQRKEFIHRVYLKSLKPDTRYFYRCGGTEGWTKVFNFYTVPTGSDWPLRFALIGDMGYKNAETFPFLLRETAEHHFDFLFHMGDFAYDLFRDNGRVGDAFLREIEPVVANLPYMGCPGNHEATYNFSNYKNRFTFPNSDNNMMYSFDVGPVHFVALSTEFYYYITTLGFWQVVRQYEWLEQDLKKANEPENRAKRPWIVTFGHRPMYCTDNDGDDCELTRDKVRVGLFGKFFGLEKLFYKYGVDVALWAHEHSYERMWPVYDRKVYNGSLEFPYTNPKAPVHLVNGAAGSTEKTDPFGPIAPWSAFRSSDYSFSRVIVHNHTHFYYDTFSADQEKIIDKIWIIKAKHGPEAWSD